MIRIMVVEEMGLLRSALRTVLSSEHDLEVVAEIGERTQILPAAGRERPDVVVVDVDLTAADTRGVLARLREQLPQVALLALSGRWTADSLRRALAAGTLGFAGTDVAPAQFVRIVRSVAGGNRVIDPAVAAAVLNPPPNPLTTREREILRAAAEGLPPKEIAVRLYLAHGTVRNRMSAILRKTGARNRLEAIRRAQERGWL
ncbi:response regulator transcription factor [Phytohabitans sp. ZYX-F-186]|uniref:Response regulator transcription factor n=1 Tax=Phytohabitans maris TaxID=3071409 RepID=A0ABU0ZA58_9ACTN|nr:response regulator transcription factor [Phytohabitans sp. ZYX-F-186]MDQ7903914.1 response regulator transcription factor [Phytohabitans sp. ZYX-F-186]